MYTPRVGHKYINYLSHVFNRNVTYRLIAGITLLHITSNHVVGITLTSGPSMDPLIDPNGTFVIYTLTTFNRIFNGFLPCYRKGDVIIAKSPVDSEKRICKRIIAIEGDSVGNKLIPPNYIWVEGDAKTNSFDSRHYGPMPMNNVLGKVRMIVSTNSIKFLR